MATMTRLSFMPARCWIAPEMPTAMYKSGATILPVCPTCQSFGTNPASTAAREAPMAAFSLSASGSSTLKLSPEPMPRPPETITRAEVSSGRQDMRVATGKADDEGREILRELLLVVRCIGHQHFLDARNRGGSLRRRRAARASDENRDLAADLRGSGHGVEGRALERR